MSDDNLELSRRKILGSVGAVGVAGAAAGLGTSALFSDEESFTNNSITAGTLDLKVSWDEHYFNGIKNLDDVSEANVEFDSPESTQTGFPSSNGSPYLAVADGAVDTFMNDTRTEQFPDGGLGSNEDPCEELADVPGAEIPPPVIDLDDVKPGDFGEVTFDFSLCDNPGYLWLQGELVSCSENGVTEPEADAEAENEDVPRAAGETPDESSLWPLLAAGAVPSSSALFDSDKREKVSEAVDKAVESDSITRKDILKVAGTGAAGAAGTAAMTGTAAAAPGDTLGTVNLNQGTGVGMTFTGTYVITPRGFASGTIDIWEPPSNPNGSGTLVATKTLPSSLPGEGTNQISGVDWDPSREKLWATYDGDPFLLIDLDDLTVTETLDSSDVSNEFSAPSGTTGWPADGVAYDRRDDTIWWSADLSTETVQINTDGTEANRITPEVNATGDQFDNNSGIAVGGDKDGRKTLYLGNNPSQANGGVIRVYADTGEYISDFATETGFRVEALVCDPLTYDSEALLIMDADTNEYKVFEAPAGICPVAGDPDPEPEPDECADVELLDAVRVRVWYDDGDNVQEDGEQVFLEGTLREALNELSDGTGIPLDGDESTNTDFDETSDPPDDPDRDCYTAAADVHYIGFEWWVPREVGNEIQSDSVTFDLGFYTEQCRNNDGFGNA